MASDVLGMKTEGAQAANEVTEIAGRDHHHKPRRTTKMNEHHLTAIVAAILLGRSLTAMPNPDEADQQKAIGAAVQFARKLLAAARAPTE